MGAPSEDDEPSPRAAAPQSAWRRRLKVLSPLFGLAIVCAAVWIIYKELSSHSLLEVWDSLKRAKLSTIAFTLGLCAFSYLMLALIERSVLQMLHREQAFPSVFKSSFVTYGASNALGYSFATAPAARARIYRDRLRAREIGALSAITAASVGLGAATAAGLSLVFGAPDLPRTFLGGAHVWRWTGLALLAPAVLWIALSGRARHAMEVMGIKFRTLGMRRASLQVGFTTLDWLSTAGILYCFLPQDIGWTYPAFVCVFVAAGVLGAVSGTPGGLGPFEAAILALAPASAAVPSLVAALVAYRIIFTLTPLAVAASVLLLDFLRRPATHG
ncbi:MAG: YbhN family protein [Caulobacterales bacterium]